MSKLKIVEINKNLLSYSQEVLDTVTELQSNSQKEIRRAKELEVELLARMKEMEEKKAAAIAEAETQPIKEEPAKETPAVQPEQKQEEKEPAKEVQAEPELPKQEPEKAAEEKPAAPKTQSEPERPVQKRQAPVQREPRTEAPRQPQAQRREPREQRGGAETRENRRPQGQRNQQGRGLKLPNNFTPSETKEKVSNYESKKQQNRRSEGSDDYGTRRKHGIKEKIILDDEVVRGRRKRPKKEAKPAPVIEPIVIEKAVITGDTVSVKTFAEKTGKPVSEILKKLLLLGMMCTINSEIDFDTASLIASEFDIELEQKIEQTAEDVLIAEDKEDDEKDLIERPPIVTIMGHVDHGKTSLLDVIRATKVTEQEAGGITQHIGAYTITKNGKPITFLDTPGHEAFTAMRARGAQVTDITILVVAADDGIMPQTIEAINHAKAAQVPIIVAINKIDKVGADPEKIKQNLTEYGLVAEEWGGDTVMVPVSAKTGEGIEQLLEMILLIAEVQELKANPNRLAKGTIVEARLDKGRGPVATVLVQNGTLKVHDTIVAGTAYGRVRAMIDDMGQPIKEAGPSIPVEVIGFSEVPTAGDVLFAVEQDRLSKQVAEERRDKIKVEKLKAMNKVSLDDLFNQIAAGQIKDLNLIVKADVQGSVEAVKQSLEKLSNDEVRVRVIHGGVGAIKESDVMLAAASNAIIIGFNVRPDSTVTAAAEKENVDIRLYRIIYNAIEDISKAMKGMLEPEFEEQVLGHAEVRQVIKVSSVGTIAGSYVQDGKITRSSSVRLIRDGVVVHEGRVSSLKRFKDDVKEVQSGYECGITLESFNDIKEGDTIEAYEMVEIER